MTIKTDNIKIKTTKYREFDGTQIEDRNLILGQAHIILIEARENGEDFEFNIDVSGGDALGTARILEALAKELRETL